MSDFEERLLRFRQARALEEEQAKRALMPSKIEVARNFFTSLIPRGSQIPSSSIKNTQEEISEATEDSSIEQTTDFKPDRIFFIKGILVFLLWLIFLIIFLKLEFGVVYFIISVLIGIYFNTGRRRPGTKSAYSVFNPNVERLQGQITAEQLQQSMFSPLG